MNRKPLHRSPGVALVVALAVSAFACGGGGGGGGSTQPLVAAFAAANANPGANTLSMTGQTNGTSAFSVRVNATGIADFFGTGFRLNFDPATAAFNGFTAAGSILGSGAGTSFQAELVAPGEVAVAATLQGQVQGTDITTTQLLITLNFTATAVTSNNPFTFGVAAERLVTTCPAPPGACTDVPDANLTWSGGTMTASR